MRLADSIFLRIIVLLASALSTLWFVSHPSFYGWLFLVIGIGGVWIAFTVFTKKMLKWSLVNYAFTPILLWTGTLSIILFTPKGFYQIAFIALTTFLSFIWATTLTYNVTMSDAFVFRGNLLSYINTFIIFFISSSLYAYFIFISFHSLAVFLAFPVITFILISHILRASHLLWKDIRPHLFTSTLIITEAFIAVVFIPTTFWVKGFLITVIFYIVAGIARCSLTSILTLKIIKRYLIWGSLIIFGILISAPWQ